MNKRNAQSGSVHLIVTIMIMLMVIGALGYALWQKSTEDKTSTESKDTNSKVDTEDKTKTPTSENSNYKTFSNELLSFNYPSSGWSVESQTLYVDVKLITNETEIGPMGLESGVMITMNKTDNQNYSIASTLASLKSKGMLKDSDIKNITIDGQVAYSFPCYEFCQQTVYFEKNGTIYVIYYSDLDRSSVAVFDNFLSTIKIK